MPNLYSISLHPQPLHSGVPHVSLHPYYTHTTFLSPPLSEVITLIYLLSSYSLNVSHFINSMPETYCKLVHLFFNFHLYVSFSLHLSTFSPLLSLFPPQPPSIRQFLPQSGSGYPCFCSRERLQSLRLQGQRDGYDGRCRSLSRRQAEEEMNRGSPFTVRMKVHDCGI